ncbi:LOW QUALITY PROTEIN: hypothetical protein ACHAXS_000531 [Conticribra weissflogii]
MGTTGTRRYNFVYVFEDGEWKIAHHYSRVMPEAFLEDASKYTVTQEKDVTMAVDAPCYWNYCCCYLPRGT